MFLLVFLAAVSVVAVSAFLNRPLHAQRHLRDDRSLRPLPLLQRRVTGAQSRSARMGLQTAEGRLGSAEEVSGASSDGSDFTEVNDNWDDPSQKYDLNRTGDPGFAKFENEVTRFIEGRDPPPGVSLDRDNLKKFRTAFMVSRDHQNAAKERPMAEGEDLDDPDMDEEDLAEMEEMQDTTLPLETPGTLLTFYNETAPYTIAHWQNMAPYGMKDGSMLVRKVPPKEFEEIVKRQPALLQKMMDVQARIEEKVQKIQENIQRRQAEGPTEDEMQEIQDISPEGDTSSIADEKIFTSGSQSNWGELAVARIDPMFKKRNDDETREFPWKSEIMRTHWFLAEQLPKLFDQDQIYLDEFYERVENFKAKRDAAKERGSISAEELEQMDRQIEEYTPAEMSLSTMKMSRVDSYLFLQQPFWEEVVLGKQRMERIHTFQPDWGADPHTSGLAGFLTRFKTSFPLLEAKTFTNLETGTDLGNKINRLLLFQRNLILWYKACLQAAWLWERNMMNPNLDTNSWRVVTNMTFEDGDELIRKAFATRDILKIGEVIGHGFTTLDDAKFPRGSQYSREEEYKLKQLLNKNVYKKLYTDMFDIRNVNPENSLAPNDNLDLVMVDWGSMDYTGVNGTFVYDIAPGPLPLADDPTGAVIKYPLRVPVNCPPEWAAMHMLDSCVKNGFADVPWTEILDERGKSVYDSPEAFDELLQKKWDNEMAPLRAPVFPNNVELTTVKKMKRRYKTGKVSRSYKFTLTSAFLTHQLGAIGAELMGGLNVREAVMALLEETGELQEGQEASDVDVARVLMDHQLYEKMREKMVPAPKGALKDETLMRETEKVIRQATQWAPQEREGGPLALAARVMRLYLFTQNKVGKLLQAVQYLVPEGKTYEDPDLDEKIREKVQLLITDQEDLARQRWERTVTEPEEIEAMGDNLSDYFENMTPDQENQIMDELGLTKRELKLLQTVDFQKATKWMMDHPEIYMGEDAVKGRVANAMAEERKKPPSDYGLTDEQAEVIAKMQSAATKYRPKQGDPNAATEEEFKMSQMPDEVKQEFARQIAESEAQMETAQEEQKELMEQIGAELKWESDDESMKRLDSGYEQEGGPPQKETTFEKIQKSRAKTREQKIKNPTGLNPFEGDGGGMG